MVDFTVLYHEHIDNLFAFGSRFTTNREVLKDCIQDVFVKLYTKRDELNRVENIESYLYVSLRNRINDEYRRNVHLCDETIDDAKMPIIITFKRAYNSSNIFIPNYRNTETTIFNCSAVDIPHNATYVVISR